MYIIYTYVYVYLYVYIYIYIYIYVYIYTSRTGLWVQKCSSSRMHDSASAAAGMSLQDVLDGALQYTGLFCWNIGLFCVVELRNAVQDGVGGRACHVRKRERESERKKDGGVEGGRERERARD